MPRAYQINGAALVMVKGNGAFATPSSPTVAVLHELGLSKDQIEIIPKWKHEDIFIDDFGPNVPAEVMWMLAEVTIRMKLIHYDRTVLKACIIESMGGGTEGVMQPAGLPMGGGVAVLQPGNHYISLGILSPRLNDPWRFRATYLDSQPLEIPVGTEASVVYCSWRAIPYTLAGDGYFVTGSQNDPAPGELISSGTVLWDHEKDV